MIFNNIVLVSGCRRERSPVLHRPYSASGPTPERAATTLQPWISPKASCGRSQNREDVGLERRSSASATVGRRVFPAAGTPQDTGRLQRAPHETPGACNGRPTKHRAPATGAPRNTGRRPRAPHETQGRQGTTGLVYATAFSKAAGPLERSLHALGFVLGTVTTGTVIVCSLLAMDQALAGPSAKGEGFTCRFEQGQAGSLEAGEFTRTKTSPLQFSITNINLEAQHAELVTKPGQDPGKLSIVRAVNANHYIEAVTEGFLNLTTVYDADPVSGKHPAVHSRHYGVLGQPVFAQFTGFCEAMSEAGVAAQ